MSIKLILTLLIANNVNLLASAQNQECPDLSPCSCEYKILTASYYVTCDGVPMQEVKSIFSNSPSLNISTLTLNIRSSGDVIPADLLGSSRVTNWLEILGASFDSFTLLEIDLNAFRSSNETVNDVYMFYLDNSRLNFNFLTTLQSLSVLSILSSSNLDKSIPTLPELPLLEDLSIEFSTGLKEAFSQPGNVIECLKCGGLKIFIAVANSLDRNSMGNLLDWILPSSRNSLAFLYFGVNELESIPTQMSSFTSLERVDISSNQVDMAIENNSIFMNSTVNRDTFKSIEIRDSRVVRVDPEAFQGNYGSCVLDLEQNSLTRFEEASFKSILQDVDNVIGPNGGYGLYIGTNPFDCYSDSCHLTWLLRDNRQLLASFKYGPPACADGTNFTDLSPNLFADCP